jgi:hypothetical protein
LASFVSILDERLGELAMAGGQRGGGGLRAICVHALDEVLVLERLLCPTVGTSFFASWKRYHMIFGSYCFSFVRHLVSGPIHTHQDFDFLGYAFVFQFEHHEGPLLISEGHSRIGHDTPLLDYIERLRILPSSLQGAALCPTPVHSWP